MNEPNDTAWPEANKVKMDPDRRAGNSREGDTLGVVRKEGKEETIDEDCCYAYLTWDQYGLRSIGGIGVEVM